MLNKTDYEKYLQTPHWRSTRNNALKRANYQGERCPQRRQLQVHHKSYERLGHELDSDLEVLCENCHRGHHERELHDAPESRLHLQLASELLRANPFADVSEIVAAVKDECVRLNLPRSPYSIDKAVNVLIGSNRFKPVQRPQTIEDVRQADCRPLTHEEAKDCLRRLGLESLIRTVPATVATIDIYGEPPEEDFSYEVF